MISNGIITLKEFEDNDKDFNTYISWLRDIDNIKMLGRQEYLLSICTKKIYDYVNCLNNSDCDSFFKVYIENDFIGTFKIGHINWRLGIGDVGIMIGNSKFRGKGWSSKIIKLGINYAFNILNLRRLTGGCYSENVAMCRCFERCDFKKEGILREALILEGTYCDHVYYGLLKKDISLKGK